MKRSLLALALAALLGAAPALAQQHSADTSASPLHWAAYSNDRGAARRLLAEGADPNAANRFGVTPLHEAARWGWNDVVTFLVAHGADLSAKDAKGNTPVDSALGKAGGNSRGGARIAPAP